MKRIVCVNVALMLCMAWFISHAVCEGNVFPIVYRLEDMDAPAAALGVYAEGQRDKLLEDYLLFSKDEINLSALEDVGFEHCEDSIQRINGQQPKSMIVMVAKEAMERQVDADGNTEITWGEFAPGVALAFGDTIHAAMINKYLASVLDRLCVFDLVDIDGIVWGGFVLSYYDKDLPQVLTSVYRINEDTLLTRTQLIYPYPSLDDYNYMKPLEFIDLQYGFGSFGIVGYKQPETADP